MISDYTYRKCECIIRSKLPHQISNVILIYSVSMLSICELRIFKKNLGSLFFSSPPESFKCQVMGNSPNYKSETVSLCWF